MNIDWAALGSVFGVSLGASVGLVALFTLGIAGLSRREAASNRGESALVATAGAYACFALCAAAVAYGISLIVS
ncbi:hypothetical protein C1I97_37105 [Streptomyces sp. NTH33]|uniref:hypothetical protein n=1 Tax=Streptomyces sp. NTH33 TaxID=1735453 RepID=UPI000DA810A6|nr:hypothetical protein [Streptomyces sp. NTH33]PZG77151.1 hypothetical protein C1I97_37105 [Streptomyces sp. NTH33]